MTYETKKQKGTQLKVYDSIKGLLNSYMTNVVAPAKWESSIKCEV